MGFTHIRCKRKFGIDGVYSLYPYRGVVRSIIISAKYQLVTEALKDLMVYTSPEILDEISSFLDKDWIVVSVPLYKTRLKKRGFNQADIIGRYFAKKLSCKYNNGLLERIKNTLPQVNMDSPNERRVNVRGAFSVRAPCRGLHIIIIDDVVTTGGTLIEIARMLKIKGAEKVIGLTIALS